MSGIALFNGERTTLGQLDAEVLVRAFRYGDGFFDSFRTHEGRALFFGPHWHRIMYTARFLHLSLPSTLSEAGLSRHISELCEATGIPNARIRIQFWRDGDGLYIPTSNNCHWLMEATPLPSPLFELNKKGLNIGICPDVRVHPLPMSSHKTLNALPYVIAGSFAQKKGWDDCLLADSPGNLTEATSSNIFLAKDQVIATPDLRAGGLAGTMRGELMRIASDAGYKVIESSITEKDLALADELLLSNAVSGIRWVIGCGKKRYYHRTADQLIKLLNEAAGIS